MSGFDDLFGEAAENASQDSFVDASWGAELKLAENERWAGRYRGEDVTSCFSDERRVHLLEEFDGDTDVHPRADEARPPVRQGEAEPGRHDRDRPSGRRPARQRQHDARLRRRGEAAAKGRPSREAGAER